MTDDPRRLAAKLGQAIPRADINAGLATAYADGYDSARMSVEQDLISGHQPEDVIAAIQATPWWWGSDWRTESAMGRIDALADVIAPPFDSIFQRGAA